MTNPHVYGGCLCPLRLGWGETKEDSQSIVDTLVPVKKKKKYERK